MSTEKSNPTNTVHFGSILKKFRESTGYSRYQLARETNRSESSLQQLENGSSEPKISTIHWYAKAIGVPAVDIIAAMLESLDKSGK